MASLDEHDFGGDPGAIAAWDGQPVSREPRASARRVGGRPVGIARRLARAPVLHRGCRAAEVIPGGSAE
ncbi:MAG: hypothetical protein ACYCXY_13800, partial [Acidimicrobiales bacterium]